MKLWMIIAAKRSGDDRLIPIIFFIPFAEWYYFFGYKAVDSRFVKFVHQLFGGPKPITLESLKAESDRSPSMINRLRYADALFDAGDYRAARSLYEVMLKATAENKQLLLRVARCLRQEGEDKVALDILSRVVSQDYKCDDYKAALELADLHGKFGQAPEAVRLLSDICEVSQRLDVRLALAKAKLSVSEGATNLGEAETVLKEVLVEFKASPGFYRKRNRWVFQEAKRLHESVQSGQV